MPDHIQFSQHMKDVPEHHPIRDTFLGQAHIAGTGPEGKTCRECRFWHKWKWSGKGYIPCPPGYFSKSHKDHPNEIKNALCNRPIINKANRLIPHDAKACRLFEPDENPMPARRNNAY